ncbi:Protein Wnt-1 [Clonorchis sinensis]|uniref:Protein Wnt n=1 Tax=Clonorchis sinensis TaxID=79923 RepID=A0A8T1LXC0_CLOSI|nr:Protein Wnt-1 [Clonorchis sinensis]
MEAFECNTWHLIPRLDTIAKLLHSHPLSTEGRRRVYAASVIDLQPNRLTYESDPDQFDWSQQAPMGQGGTHNIMMHGLTSQQNAPSVVGWRRKSRMPVPYDHSSWMADRLRERIELYRKWMSPRQWKQFLSETLPGRENQRFNLALFEAASVGVRRAVAECRFQFRYERWNCSQSSDEDTALFGNILLKGIPQTAFVYSIINAGIVQSVAEACLGQIDNCPCNNRGREISSADWQWQGCDHNIHFGSKFSRRLLDTMERGSHIRYRMNLHNNKVGRMLVTRNMERHCRCHGTSGSCTLRTCYRRTPRMRTLGNLLKQMYERHLVRLQPNYAIDAELRGPTWQQKLPNQFTPRQNQPTYRYMVNRVQRTAFQHPFPSSTNEGIYSRQWNRRNQQRALSSWNLKRDQSFPLTEINLTNPSYTHLVYYEPTPNKLFCEAEPQLHITGTHGRVCNSSSLGADNCHHLCCGRGHLTHHFYVMESCHCKFIWCCRVECQQCLVLKRVETCN